MKDEPRQVDSLKTPPMEQPTPALAPSATQDLDRRYIYRREARNLWAVSITRKRQKVGSKEFCDATHGGREGALAAAMAYRDTVLASAVPYNKSEFASKLKAHNTSKVPGVVRGEATHKTRHGTMITQVHWMAIYQGVKSKQKRTRYFSVFKYGEQGAYELAVQARAQMLQEFALEEQDYLPRVPKGTPDARPQEETGSA